MNEHYVYLDAIDSRSITCGRLFIFVNFSTNVCFASTSFWQRMPVLSTIFVSSTNFSIFVDTRCVEDAHPVGRTDSSMARNMTCMSLTMCMSVTSYFSSISDIYTMLNTSNMSSRSTMSTLTTIIEDFQIYGIPRILDMSVTVLRFPIKNWRLVMDIDGWFWTLRVFGLTGI